MATSKIQVTEGSGKNISSYSFSEDTVTKEAQRTALNNSSGTEIGTNSNPIQIGDAGGSLTIDGSATPVPATSGGLSIYHLVATNSTNATNVKASAGQLYGWYIYNSNAAARKIAFHNTAGTPTAGASILFSLVIPPTSGANVSLEMGIAFSTGIAFTTVTELTDAGTTAVGASDLIINLFYK